MAGWDEVQQIYAKFLDVQESTAKQKLSERNVIEIVSKLVELNLVDIIYTIDGKEYLTPQELVKEIRDELIVHGGRINLVELQQILNIDLKHIEGKVNDMVKGDHSLFLVLGQLIDSSYLDKLAEEVNDKLQDVGHVTVAELTTVYDLPADFLSEHIHSRIGKIIKGQVDKYDQDVLFTDAFILRMKAQIRGSFSAITKPTVVSIIKSRYGFQDRLFFTILEDLVSAGRLAGSISGGRQDKATYVPNIYSKTQNEWIDSFYKQNGYLEYDALVRLGIQDPKGFIKKRFKSEPMTYLASCCVGKGIKDQVEYSIEEAIQGNTWVDIMPILPSIVSPEDANILLNELTSSVSNACISCDTIVSSQQFISKFGEVFKKKVDKRAEQDARSNPLMFEPESEKKHHGKAAASEEMSGGKDDRKEQRKKKAQMSAKSGGGTQGREVKTKSLSKKKGKGKDVQGDSDDEGAAASSKRSATNEPVFMSVEELTLDLSKQPELRDCPEQFLEEIAEKLYRPLNKQYQEKAKSIFLTQAGSSGGMSKKKTQQDLQDKVGNLWTNCKLYEKGAMLFTDLTEELLFKHLLKTVCTDIVNIVVNAVATDHLMSVNEEENITLEGRQKIIKNLPIHVQPPLVKLNASLAGKNLDEFYKYLDVVCAPDSLAILLKKPDKRKERQLIFNQRQALIEQLNNETDPALCFHLACVILFQVFTQNILHAPGRCVPAILQHIKPHLEEDVFRTLLHYQDKVTEFARLTSEGKDEEKEKVLTFLEEHLGEIKDIATKTKAKQSPDKETK